MFLYRALNDYDMESLKNGNDILSSLEQQYLEIDNVCRSRKKKIDEEYSFYLEKNAKFGLSLNAMIGHVGGKKTKSHLSPWISTSSDYDFVASEYAVPQVGSYNTDDKRKNIAVIDFPTSNILSDNDDIKRFSKCNFLGGNVAVDLRNDKLRELYEKDIIDSEGTIHVSNGKIVKSDLWLSSFATSASELLVYRKIDKNLIRTVLYPIIQDIVYSCNIDLENDNVFIKRMNDILDIVVNELSHNTKLRDIYTSLEQSPNLTDILYEQYSSLGTKTIEEKYKEFKVNKALELISLVGIINDKLDTNYQVKKLVDNRIIVSSHNNLESYSSKQLHDIVLIDYDNDVFKYNSSVNDYVNNSNDKLCELNNDIKKILKKNKK